MYKRIKRSKLGRTESHRKSLIKNMLRSLFDKNSVVTTTAKAKVLKQNADSLILKGKAEGESLSFRRKLQEVLGSDELVAKYKEYIKKEKVGVLSVKVGFRAGDNAEQTKVVLVGTEKKKKKVEKKEETKEEKKDVVQKEERKGKRFDGAKKVDTTTVVNRTERAKSRSGL